MQSIPKGLSAGFSIWYGPTGKSRVLYYNTGRGAVLLFLFAGDNNSPIVIVRLHNINFMQKIMYTSEKNAKNRHLFDTKHVRSNINLKAHTICIIRNTPMNITHNNCRHLFPGLLLRNLISILIFYEVSTYRSGLLINSMFHQQHNNIIAKHYMYNSVVQ